MNFSPYRLSAVLNIWLKFPISLRNVKYGNKYFVDNKAKGRISKQVFQENKARQIFRKTNISYPLIRFSENLACFVFLKHPF